jgi:acetoin utilization deacetylase AcuC-like enzyme
MESVGFVYDEIFLKHAVPSGHPERPDRLKNLVGELQARGTWKKLRHLSPRPVTKQELLAVHSDNHIEHVREVSGRGGGMLDEGETYASPKSYEVATFAAGAVIVAIDALVAGTVTSAFCAVRPPGHHAERETPMGFCLFNNIAVGARYALHVHKKRRIAILDWDVHHGNGTQHCFEEDDRVLFISLHQYPFYPGTGSRSERGRGKGLGATINIPLPVGTGEEGYARAFHDEIIPALKAFSPEMLLISAGFDAHKDDPLAGMMLTESSYALFTRLMQGIAPIASVLEGGYDLYALAESVDAHLRVLLRDSDG